MDNSSVGTLIFLPILGFALYASRKSGIPVFRDRDELFRKPTRMNLDRCKMKDEETFQGITLASALAAAKGNGFPAEKLFSNTLHDPASDYPTPECLGASDVDDYCNFQIEISKQDKIHLETCPPCRGMLGSVLSSKNLPISWKKPENS